MHINESAENYLETILMLSKVKPVVRSVDIAEELNFKKSSVSVAMKNLREHGYVETSSEGYITLTDKGIDIASKMYERHTIISDYLISLGVSPKIAMEDACKIEHVISSESFNAIKKSLDK